MNTKKLLSTSSPIAATVDLPGSKSITNRALLLAALASGVSELSGALVSEDSLAFVGALQALGVHVEQQAEVLQVHGSGQLQSADLVYCKDAGTAARFLCAACSAFPIDVLLDGTPRLRERPLATLIDTLKQLGARIDASAMPCRIEGASLTGGSVSLDARDSTQFISALLMIAPLMQSSLTVTATHLNRDAYIQITTQMMQAFGVTVERDGNQFHVPAGQHYQAQAYAIEPDLSTASYFFAAAAVTGGAVTVNRINRAACLQGDIRFLSVLESMGCEVTVTASSVTVTGPKQLTGVDINMQDFSDPFMTLAAIAPYANSPTKITGLAHTRLQESDRVSAIASELTKLGVSVKTGEDWIQISPSTPTPATVFSHNDHRIAMSLSILALKTPGIQLEQPNCVAKTCPDFFALLGEIIGS